ncbi:hypothetical protein ACFV0O_31780 [Kitasatospora sp. NPDC059577]|uniref:hypothetical protein n=1 Tax=Kitasatospora sp. NPDC059577 TaxID=3346873 RepID=UPI0036752546
MLHRFDPAGRHLDSRVRATATGPDARQLLDAWPAALPGREYRDIAIEPFEVRVDGELFEVRVDGELFGLVVEEDDEVEEDEEDLPLHRRAPPRRPGLPRAVVRLLRHLSGGRPGRPGGPAGHHSATR